MDELLEYMAAPISSESDDTAAPSSNDTVARVLQWLFGALLVIALLVSLLYYHRTALMQKFVTPKLR